MYYLRTPKQEDWPRGWRDDYIIGPEGRVVLNGDIEQQYSEPDKLMVEFVAADEAHLSKLVNVKEENWNVHPRTGGLEPIKGNPAFTIFGAGGFRRGFDENDYNKPLTYSEGLRADLLDDGFDDQYKKVAIVIPDTFVSLGLLRIRIRVHANNNGVKGLNYDDDDTFYIDNIKLVKNIEKPDIGITALNVRNQYTIIPAKQARKIPLSVGISNYSNIQGTNFSVNTKIAAKGTNNYLYNETIKIPSINPISDLELSLPPLDMNIFKGYTNLQGITIIKNYANQEDADSYNDTLYSLFRIRTGKVFAYDSPDNPKDDVGDFSGIWYQGLSLKGFSTGDGSFESSFGTNGGSGAGQIALRFDLNTTDTVYGIQALYSWCNTLDEIKYSFYNDRNNLPGDLIQGSVINTVRCWDDITNNGPISNEYITSLYKKPVILPAGRYWAAISQLGETGINLGGSKSQMGLTTLSYDSLNQGKTCPYLFLNKKLRRYDSIVINETKYRGIVSDNIAAYRNGLDTGKWIAFVPPIGNPGYAHLDYAGRIYNNYKYNIDSSYSIKTFSRGTFIPMLRIFMDNSYYKPNDVEEQSKVENKSISIFPNPARDEAIVSISGNHAGNYSLNIYSIEGIKLESREFTNTGNEQINKTISISTVKYPSGVYFIVLNSPHGVERERLIVVK
ncbi:MAG: FlgD ig protein [Ignavibacteria bacterium]|nr:FlgD ig protein [Ignavibacteria bacterium]